MLLSSLLILNCGLFGFTVSNSRDPKKFVIASFSPIVATAFLKAFCRAVYFRLRCALVCGVNNFFRALYSRARSAGVFAISTSIINNTK